MDIVGYYKEMFHNSVIYAKKTVITMNVSCMKYLTFLELNDVNNWFYCLDLFLIL